MSSSPSQSPLSRLQLAQLRAHALKSAREFFSQKRVLEVDTPILSQGVSLDAHIDFFEAFFYPMGIPGKGKAEVGYLQTSPEPHLKRLLCEGFPDLYQMAKCFRNGETGKHHNPEFTMVEWYRRGFGLAEMEKETLEFCLLIGGTKPVQVWTWEEVWKRFLGVSPFEISEAELRKHPDLEKWGVSSDVLPALPDVWDFLMSHSIEPHFDPAVYTLIRHFPIEQASQSQAHPEFPHLSMRFEVYSGGMELANGYQELLDPGGYRNRFGTELSKRAGLTKPLPEVDGRLLAALQIGLPECSGVAVGFDRLIQLAAGVPSLSDCLLFPWGSH